MNYIFLHLLDNKVYFTSLMHGISMKTVGVGMKTSNNSTLMTRKY